MIRTLYLKVFGPIFYRIHNRDRGKKMELGFWNNWLNTCGSQWKEDYVARLDKNGELRWPHNEIVSLTFHEKYRILDVGSGPITNIGYKLNSLKLDITACDHNAKEYKHLLKQHGIVPPIESIAADGESLTKVFKGKYNYITCNNALDHMKSPKRCIEEMCTLLADDGIIFLDHEINEGENEGYRGYHKWNIQRLDNKSFRIWSPREEYVYDQETLSLPIRARNIKGSVLIIISSNRTALEWLDKQEADTLL